jgi:hypothetical protein
MSVTEYGLRLAEQEERLEEAITSLVFHLPRQAK